MYIYNIILYSASNPQLYVRILVYMLELEQQGFWHLSSVGITALA